jgi:Methylenetetrahydrofolate reductase
VLALRGDPSKGSAKWEATAGGLTNAIDLVKLIREEHGDYFGIAVAGHPEGHIESTDKHQVLIPSFVYTYVYVYFKKTQLYLCIRVGVLCSEDSDIVAVYVVYYSATGVVCNAVVLSIDVQQALATQYCYSDRVATVCRTHLTILKMDSYFCKRLTLLHNTFRCCIA